MIKNKIVLLATLALSASLSYQAQASTFTFNFSGSGTSGALTLTYGTATDSKDPQGLEVTGITGTFSDSNNGLVIS